MVVLTLGDFTFTRYEVPEKIVLGGDQRMVIHEAVGGNRTIDAMGHVYDPLAWSGLFLGKDALTRAKYLDHLRKQGKPLVLKWSKLAFTVVIRRFQYDFVREYNIPYSITCEVLVESSVQVTNIDPIDVYKSLVADMGSAVGAADAMGPDQAAVKSKVSSLKSSFDSAKKMVKATQAQIKEVKNKIQDVQAEVTRQLASANNTLQSISTLGGILPRNPVSVNAGKLTNKAKVLNNSTQLMNLKYSMGRMHKNVNTLKGAK